MSYFLRKPNMTHLSFVALLCILPTFFFVAGHEFDPNGWRSASEWILPSMDFDADPCNDFYRFVCGKWEETKGDDESDDSEGGKVQRLMHEKIMQAIENVDESNPLTKPFKKSAKTFLTQCRSTPPVENEDDKWASIEEVYVNLVNYLTKKLTENEAEIPSGGRNATSILWRFVGVFQRLLGTPFPIEADVLPTHIGAGCRSEPTLHLLPSVSSHLDLSEEFVDKMLALVVKHYGNDASISADEISKTKAAILEFSFNITTFMEPLEKTVVDSYDPWSFYEIKRSKLPEEFPGIDWDSYFSGLLTDIIRSQWEKNDPTVVLEYRDYFANLSSIVQLQHPLTVMNFATIITLLKYQKFFEKGELKFYERRHMQKQISGDPCEELILQYFSTAALRIVVEEYKIDVRKWRNDLLLLKDLVFSAFRFLIDNTEYLDNEDRTTYMEAVKKISFYGGIPSWIMDDDTVDAKTPLYNESLSLIANDMAAQLELFRQKMKPLLTGIMEDMPPNFYNTAYNDMYYNIRYLIGSQLPPYYSYTYPIAVKFGTVGVILGHELMHSFGTFLFQNHLFEYHTEEERAEILNLKQSTFETIREKAECYIPLYDRYCKTEREGNFKDGACFIGKRTLEETLADHEGLNLAYTAYKFVTQTMGMDPPMDDLVQFNGEQIFFISSIKEYCELGPIESIKFDPNDTHSSSLSRSEQVFANFPPFARAFGCKSGDRYYRNATDRCSLYGKFWGQH